ncbi:hypothetical protein PFICI_08999 [Pestalotiopsis fici W106-1]|uniref:Ubiquitin-like protease family profile domain-containing protein n=1 Tax=Pestalotiopsis fici (strain W106-1 / CGMCC3.15140) TaxID=1229662 RepID=W3X1V3_PESFW|nr:uncharacterized protein PFICI_08999 [Pestalotiopsis fici W106-1]ETS79146.1 hypothetical protein PFICI_08999 [Pestalotiopsis fici W106-1]
MAGQLPASPSPSQSSERLRILLRDEWEAHREGRKNAREVGAPSLPFAYAPTNLRTYKGRQVNSFRAPNPGLTRFRLPGESDIVYPDDPVRPSKKIAAKRAIDEIATPNDTEQSSSKRQKVPLASTPLITSNFGSRIRAKRAFHEIDTTDEPVRVRTAAWVNTTPSAKRQKVLLPSTQTDPDSGSHIRGTQRIPAKRAFHQIASDDTAAVEIATSANTTPSFKRQKKAPAPTAEPTSDSDDEGSVTRSLSPIKGDDYQIQSFPPIKCHKLKDLVTQRSQKSSHTEELPTERALLNFSTILRPEKIKAGNNTSEEKLGSEKLSSQETATKRPLLLYPTSRRFREIKADNNTSDKPSSGRYATERSLLQYSTTATQRFEKLKAARNISKENSSSSKSTSTRPPLQYLTSRRFEENTADKDTSEENLTAERPRVRYLISRHSEKLEAFKKTAAYTQSTRRLTTHNETSRAQIIAERGLYTRFPIASSDQRRILTDFAQLRRPLERRVSEQQEFRQQRAQQLPEANAQGIQQPRHQEWQLLPCILVILHIVMAITTRLWTVATFLQKVFTNPRQILYQNVNHGDSARDESAEDQNTQTNRLLPGTFPGTNEDNPQDALQSPQPLPLDDVNNNARQNGTLPEEQDAAMNTSPVRNIYPTEDHVTASSTNTTTDIVQHEDTAATSSVSLSSRDGRKLSDAHSTVETDLPQQEIQRSSRKYSDSSEEWRHHDAARRQLYHEAFDRNYSYEKDQILAKDQYRSTGLTPAQNLECVQRASVLSKAAKPKSRPTYKNPRSFFDDENQHSLPHRTRTTLKPNHHKLEEDGQDRAAREKREQELAEQKRYEEANAKLKNLGLSVPRAPVIIKINDKWEGQVHNTQKPAFKPLKTCAPEPVEFGHRDFLRLVPRGTWLNDSCIQAATQYGADYINKAAGVTLKKDTPRCVALNSFFWSSLVSSGVSGKERMLKRVWGLTPQNFLDVESLIIPINADAHWTFIFVRPQRREIAYVDSFHTRNQKRIDKALEFVAAFLGPRFKEDEWKQVSFNVPRQTNSYDCGMFVITNSLLLSLGLDPSDYTEPEMGHQRSNIAAMILNGGYHGDFDLKKLYKL